MPNKILCGIVGVLSVIIMFLLLIVGVQDKQYLDAIALADEYKVKYEEVLDEQNKSTPNINVVMPDSYYELDVYNAQLVAYIDYLSDLYFECINRDI